MGTRNLLMASMGDSVAQIYQSSPIFKEQVR